VTLTSKKSREEYSSLVTLTSRKRREKEEVSSLKYKEKEEVSSTKRRRFVHKGGLEAHAPPVLLPYTHRTRHATPVFLPYIPA